VRARKKKGKDAGDGRIKGAGKRGKIPKKEESD
jgi:hypothetical protein